MLQKRAITLLLNICLVLSVSRAQTFQLMRYDESYADLRDSARTFYHRVKYAPLFNGQVYVSFGGEVRWEFDAFDNEDWGAFHAGKDNFLLQRYDLHADLHLSDRLRFFAQLRSGLENGRPHGPRPIDEDKLNVQNLFGDIRIWKTPKDTLTFRGGRQEINYGSGRLISVREGPNLRLYFTGAKWMYASKNLTVDAFATGGRFGPYRCIRQSWHERIKSLGDIRKPGGAAASAYRPILYRYPQGQFPLRRRSGKRVQTYHGRAYLAGGEWSQL